MPGAAIAMLLASKGLFVVLVARRKEALDKVVMREVGPGRGKGACWQMSAPLHSNYMIVT